MMNTFQFIGLGWRCWRTKDSKTRREVGVVGLSRRESRSEPVHCAQIALFSAAQRLCVRESALLMKRPHAETQSRRGKQTILFSVRQRLFREPVS